MESELPGSRIKAIWKIILESRIVNRLKVFFIEYYFFLVFFLIYFLIFLAIPRVHIDQSWLHDWEYSFGKVEDRIEDTREYSFTPYKEKIIKMTAADILPAGRGIIWLKKEFTIDESLLDKDVSILLGKIEYADKAYINGNFIGSTGKFPPYYWSAWNKFRNYNVPTRFLNAGGKNTLLIKVFANNYTVLDKFIVLDEKRVVDSLYRYEKFANMDIFFICTYIMIIFAVYYFILYLISLKEKENLFLSFIFLGIGVYFFDFHIVEMPVIYDFNIPYFYFQKVIACLPYFLIYLFARYLWILAEYKEKKIIRWLLYGIIGIMIAVRLVAPNEEVFFTHDRYLEVIIAIPSVYFLYFFIFIFVQKKSRHVIPILISIFIMLGCAIYDVILDRIVRDYVPNLMAFGFTAFFIRMASVQFSRHIDFKSISELNVRLQAAVEARTRELREAQKQLLATAHKAGMAEIATNVLHNAGNVLNSVVTSANILRDIILGSKVTNIIKSSQMLKEHKDELEKFLLHDPKGKMVFNYYIQVEEVLKREHSDMTENMKRLLEKVHMIDDIINEQEKYTEEQVFFAEEVQLKDLVEELIRFNQSSIESNNIEVSTEFSELPLVTVHKKKLLHILINLYNNAKDAINETGRTDKKLGFRVYREGETAHLAITDNGCGIPKENFKKIFTHGFTTKVNGHGFGLHSCANYMHEMGGGIDVDSGGPGEGAVFKLSFPLGKSADGNKKEEVKALT